MVAVGSTNWRWFSQQLLRSIGRKLRVFRQINDGTNQWQQADECREVKNIWDLGDHGGKKNRIEEADGGS